MGGREGGKEAGRLEGAKEMKAALRALGWRPGCLCAPWRPGRTEELVGGPQSPPPHAGSVERSGSAVSFCSRILSNVYLFIYSRRDNSLCSSPGFCD